MTYHLAQIALDCTALRLQHRLKMVSRGWLALLFSIPLTGFAATPQAITVLHAFSGSDGSNPRAALLKSGDGNFYGTTYRGGYGHGSVFKLTPAGAFVILHHFTGNDGSMPSGRLVSDRPTHFMQDKSDCESDDAHEHAQPVVSAREGLRRCDRDGGIFFGTTESGGAASAGTVFKITASGILTSLHDFSGSDGSAPTGLVRASDGSFYGATQTGGPIGYGTIFKITPTGQFTTLYAFSGSDGSMPRAAPVQGSDGNFYGTTEFGGAFNSGTVFKVTPAGVLTTLHNFNFGSDGALPLAGLIQGRDGNYYGTTYAGARGYGTVFQITPAGTLTTLHAFYPGDGDGGHPFGELVQELSQDFYGTTEAGGSSGLGTIFKITAAGEFTTVLAFDGSNGSNPQAGLTRAGARALYGTAANGGPNGSGVIFKVHPLRSLKKPENR